MPDDHWLYLLMIILLWGGSLAALYFHMMSKIKYERKLHRSARHLVEATDLMAFLYDMRSDKLRFSPACARLLGLPETVDDFTWARDSGSETMRKGLAIVTDAMIPDIDHERLQIERPNGSTGTYRVTSRTFYTDNEEIDCIVGFFTDITKETQREERLELHAQLDGLTHVLNSGTVRRKLHDAVSEFDNSQLGAFLIMDIDHFKDVNDQLGHQAGDQVLRIVARVLKSNLRSNDIVGRLGGDEFCVYLLGLPSRDYLPKLCARINAAVRKEAEREHIELPITVSIGATWLEPKDAFQKVYERADKALYTTKENGRNGYAVAS